MLKSYAISMLLHASLVAALWVIPLSTTERYAQTGQTQVVSIEAIQGMQSSTLDLALDPHAFPLTSELDSQADQRVPTEPIEPRELSVSRDKTRQPDHPPLVLPATPMDVPIDRELLLKRRHTEDSAPEMTIVDTLPRPPKPRPIAEPPAASAIPIEQFVGLEEKSSADLSNNRPPAYPLEAVRRRLEGVVLLQLVITGSGKVDDVTVVKSSGHPILDDAAVDAVTKWNGRPARRWGKPVESIERLPIRFRL